MLKYKSYFMRNVIQKDIKYKKGIETHYALCLYFHLYFIPIRILYIVFKNLLLVIPHLKQ